MQGVLTKIERPPLLLQGGSYQEWSKRFKCCVSLHDNDLAQAMSVAESSEVREDLGAEHHEADRVPYYTLPMVASDKSLPEVQNVTGESGAKHAVYFSVDEGWLRTAARAIPSAASASGCSRPLSMRYLQVRSCLTP